VFFESTNVNINLLTDTFVSDKPEWKPVDGTYASPRTLGEPGKFQPTDESLLPSSPDHGKMLPKDPPSPANNNGQPQLGTLKPNPSRNEPSDFIPGELESKQG
jgi:hypothetical protein